MAAIMFVDRDRRYFICSGSTSNLISATTRARWRRSEVGAILTEIDFMQPEAVQLYYSVRGKIDQHNRCRQADLNIEKIIQTQSWSFRVCTTILAMIIVDSWYSLRLS